MNPTVNTNEIVARQLPSLLERRRVHILNPAAGKKKHYLLANRTIEQIGGEIMTSDRPGQIEELTRELFRRDPYAHAIVYGGDGTVFEAVNGLMNSGASKTASFSVIPGGSGNDFSAYANSSGKFAKTELSRIDLIRAETAGKVRYCANITNIGLDCDVVAAADKLRRNPLFNGKTSYLAGVAKVFAAKKTFHAKLKLENVVNFNGSPLADIECEDDLLICAFANSQFYGGGFRAAPLASLTDGMMEVITVNDVTRAQFVSLLGDYRAGSYISKNGKLKKKFEGLLNYNRCRKATLDGAPRICMDGEIFSADAPVTVEVLPSAAWFVAL